MYTRRLIEKDCARVLDGGKILVLTGARQTGKTSLVREILRSVPEPEKLLLNLDDPFLRDRLVETEGSLVREIEEKARKPWKAVARFHLVLDEAQKAPALFERIKDLHESDPSKLRIVLTGSSALQIDDPVAETLAGRVRILKLHPFTLSEGFAHERGEEPTEGELPHILSRLLNGRFTSKDFEALSERARWHAQERRRWTERHLLFPLFPEPAASAEPEVWIRDYLATYMEKDIQSLAEVGSLALFRAALRQVAARMGSTVKWETMAQEMGASPITLRKYVGLMEQTLNLVRLSPFAVNPVKRIVKAPKLYFTDPGLAWGLRGFEDRHLLESSGMLGAYAELLAVVEIAKWCSFEPTSPELSFWAKTAVSEVDLIVSNRGYHIPFEVKLGKKLDPSWIRGLDAFDADHQPLKIAIPYRFVLYQGDPVKVGGRTYALPLWALT